MKRSNKVLFVGIFFAVLGVIGVTPTLYYRLQNRVKANPAQVIIPSPQLVATPTLVTGKPTQVTINSLQLSLPVADGVYNPKNGQWTLSKDKAHFALISTQPNNEQGNTLIYGHYRPEVFAGLPKLKPGNEAVITTDNGYRFIYRYTTTQAVKPTDTSIFAYQGPPRLTLQTCSGAWLQNRQLYTFEFVGYEKV